MNKSFGASLFTALWFMLLIVAVTYILSEILEENRRLEYLDRHNCIEISRTSQKYEHDKVTYKCEVKDKP